MFERVKKALMAVVFVLLLCSFYEPVGATVPEDAQLVTETYIVSSGEGLDKISYIFMAKNTYGSRYLPEFREGIVQNNWELLKDRYPHGMIKGGDKLVICYWVRKGE